MATKIETGSSPLADIIIMLGDDRLSVEEEITAITKEGGQVAFSELNTTHLDGSVLNINEISIQLTCSLLGVKKGRLFLIMP